MKYYNCEPGALKQNKKLIRKIAVLKGIFNKKINNNNHILSLFSQHHVVPKLSDFLLSKQKNIF